MFGKLNHLTITTRHNAMLGMFYYAVFGMKVSGDTYVDHFGIEVEDVDKVREARNLKSEEGGYLLTDGRVTIESCRGKFLPLTALASNGRRWITPAFA